ncbi:glycine-rich domain-containing protein [Pseudoalteromonas rubra]|uniref:glycine-rich domain-containing protein n=1 Tax=Pseudoalteromonas rubra TaxID=43658 RepID=UPI000F7B3B35|nr:hypothetical protein [Pseudoalteromonas rubra]
MTNFNKRLNELDLSKVIHRLKTTTGATNDQCALAEALYRQFLTLKARYPNTQIAPPQVADDVWHEHLTDTVSYHNDCNALFGEYLHHIPDEDNQDAWQTAVRLYQSEFNVDVSGLEPAYCR